MRPGIETAQRACVAALRVNLAVDARAAALAALRRLGALLAEQQVASSSLADVRPHADAQATCVIGVSARFFRGPLRDGRDESRALRFGMDRPAPRCLRRMALRGDELFAGVATFAGLERAESDLVILLEAQSFTPLERLLESVQALGVFYLAHIDWGFRRDDGMTDLGYREGTSNLQDLARDAPDIFRRYVYTQAGDEPVASYVGGSYLVLRTYRLHAERWFADNFEVRDLRGERQVGQAARDRVIGRSATDGRVIDERGQPVAPAWDGRESARAYVASHVRHANPRGSGRTQFGTSVRPPDLRILRRPFSLGRPSPDREPGVLFLCYQREIQHGGFEFIHNNWLLSTGFLGGQDPLLAPASGIITPLSGCYFFVPPPERFPAATFLGG